MHFLPFIFLFFIIYFILLGGLFFIIQLGAIGFAFDAIGISMEGIFMLLAVSLLGSAINIPVKKISTEIAVPQDKYIRFMGWRFRIPQQRRINETLIAINLGGALIPIGLSLYLLLSNPGIFVESIIATAVLAIVVNKLARPIQGVGIGVPLFIPPVVAAIAAIILSDSYSPLIAYVAGTVGTLIGADLLNLKEIAKSGAPVASIGGAGTFDGIFLTGIIAVLLASIG